MKYLFLVIAAVIAVTSAKAYMVVGAELMGNLGRIGALAVFLLVQGFELRPIVLTNGQANAFTLIRNLMAGKGCNVSGLADPEELLDAASWAYRAYAVDLIAGLMVWPIIDALPGVSTWMLIKVGGVVGANINWANAGQVVACVFLLEFCVQQYLRMGGRLPAFIGGRKSARV